MDKKIRKETLRKLLAINTNYFHQQNKKIDSLERQLSELKKVKVEKTKLAKAYAKKIGVLKTVKQIKV